MAIQVQITIDCADPARLATFWAQALHYKKQDPPEGFASWDEYLQSINMPQEEWNSFSAIVDPEGKEPRIFLQRVPEAKTVKNRVHLDVNASKQATDRSQSGQRQYLDKEVERLKELGAKELHRYEENKDYWITLADPEGNEFCIQ